MTTIRFIRRVVVTVVGAALISVGLVLLVLPGPGILLVVAGLAVLGTEYAWAKSLLVWTKDRAQTMRHRVRNRPGSQPS